jgi:PTH2 family peptidyl-tRNA hydrolase
MFMLLRRQTRPLINMPTGDCKLVILVRTDLNMTKGKAAAQCCHAVLETYKQATRNYPEMVQRWEDLGQPKITLKVESDAELAELVGKARKAGLAAQAIRDAGRTQLIPGTRTVAAIGPGPAKMIDIITGHLKLY